MFSLRILFQSLSKHPQTHSQQLHRASNSPKIAIKSGVLVAGKLIQSSAKCATISAVKGHKMAFLWAGRKTSAEGGGGHENGVESMQDGCQPSAASPS